MNQLYRALHMPPARLLKKLLGHKEIYTVGWRKYTPGESLPETGSGTFARVPYDPAYWYADPILFEVGGRHWLFTEAFRMADHKGLLAVSEMKEDGPTEPQIILEEPFHLSFPHVFRWRGGIWMLPETGNDHSLRLYRCVEFPGKWELAYRYDAHGAELCDSIFTEVTDEKLEILCSETLPQDQLQVKYRRFTITGEGENMTCTPDTAFNEVQSWNYTDRAAGPLCTVGEKTLRPAQVSTDIDYGVALQFWHVTENAETPDAYIGCDDVRVEGIARSNMVGVHTYGHDSKFEIIDLRYLK